jgi:hypothetical protein
VHREHVIEETLQWRFFYLWQAMEGLLVNPTPGRAVAFSGEVPEFPYRVVCWVARLAKENANLTSGPVRLRL